MSSPEGPRPYENWRVACLGLLAVLMLMPVTMPVTVLRAFVQERFGVSEFMTSLFMSINMVGAVLSAPIAGALADRFGRRRALIIAALLADAVLLFSLTLDLPFPVFMGLRLFEGAAHIFALSLLLSVAAHARGEAQRGRVMGIVGGGITLGVAIGAPLGGAIGRTDPLIPFYVGCVVVTLGALLTWTILLEVEAEARQETSLARIVAALRERKLLLAPLAFAFVDRFTVGFYTTTFSLYLSRIHELPSQQIGLLIGAFMLPFALCSYPFGRLSEKSSPVWMVCGGSVLYGIGTALVPWWPESTLLVLLVLLGIASAVMFVPSMVLITQLASNQARGTALGAFNAAGSLGFIVGPVTGGLISQWVAGSSGWESGYRAAFAVAGASEILCVAVTLPFLLKLVRSRS